MRAWAVQIIQISKSLSRSAPGENSSTRKQVIMLNRLFLIGAIAGIALAHGVVLYKIDKGARSSEAAQVMASRSHRAFW
jgi:hypothetical protein